MVQIAIIAGVAIVVTAAVIFIFAGSGENPPPSSGNIQPGTTGQAGAVQTQAIRTSPAGGTTLDPASITIPTTVAVPGTGIYIRVSYLGSYSGTYSADGVIHSLQDSGDKLFKVENTSQTISASFKKTDRSIKQTLSVEIWKNGKILQSASTTELFGRANVSAAV